jgi:hypothetical protein
LWPTGKQPLGSLRRQEVVLGASRGVGGCEDM